MVRGHLQLQRWPSLHPIYEGNCPKVTPIWMSFRLLIMSTSEKHDCKFWRVHCIKVFVFEKYYSTAETWNFCQVLLSCNNVASPGQSCYHVILVDTVFVTLFFGYSAIYSCMLHCYFTWTPLLQCSLGGYNVACQDTLFYHLAQWTWRSWKVDVLHRRQHGRKRLKSLWLQTWVL